MEPLPAPPGSVRAARRILAVAALLHLFSFANECRGQLRGLFAAPANPLVRGYDGHGYYAWLRSLMIDGDWQFGNEFDQFRHTLAVPDPDLPLTPTGRVMNQWSVGPAILWAPVVLPVHAVVRGDGYSPPYQLAVGTATFAAGLLTLALFYAIARRFAEPVAAACAAGVMTLGTSVVAYGSVELAMAHGPATAALAAFVWVWLRTFGSLAVRRWVLVGFLLGVAALFRWQLVTFAVLPCLEAAWLGRGRAVACLAAAGVGAVVGFLPQMAAWQIVYGQPLVQPHGPAKNWLAPAVLEVLFSTDRGFVYWTPLTLAAFAGLVLSGSGFRLSPLPQCFIGGEGKRGSASAGEGDEPARREKPHPLTRRRSDADLSPAESGERWKPRAALVMLAVAALCQIYALAAVYAPPVSLGGSFGFRFLAETCAVLVPGVAVLFARSRAALLVAVPLVVWNLLLLGVHRYAIDGFTSGGPGAMLHAVGRYVVLRPIDAAAVILTSGWLAVVMSRYHRGARKAGNPEKSLPTPARAA